MALCRCACVVLAAWAFGAADSAGAVGPTGAIPLDIERARAEPAQARILGDTLHFTGNLSPASTAAFDAAVAGVARGQVTRLVISSGGGDTVAGRHVGRWVRDMGLVVEVDVICFSSCADYVFPAGRARVIRAPVLPGNGAGDFRWPTWRALAWPTRSIWAKAAMRRTPLGFVSTS
jgi:hypothetical protein